MSSADSPFDKDMLIGLIINELLAEIEILKAEIARLRADTVAVPSPGWSGVWNTL